MKLSSTKNMQRLAITAGLTVIASGAAIGSPFSTAHAATYTLDFDQGANGGNVLYNTDGSLVTTQWSSMGLKDITGTNNRTNGAAVFNTYDSDTHSDSRDNWLKDRDLYSGSQWGTEAQGNLLIIQEQDNSSNDFAKNGTAYRADDEAHGGNVKFEFDQSVLFNSFSLMDVDDDDHRSSKINIVGTGANGGFDIDIQSLIKGHKDTHTKDSAKGSYFTKNGVTITQMGDNRGNNSLYKFDLDANYFSNMRVENIEFQYPGSGAIAGIEWSTEDAPQEVPESSTIGALLMVGFVAKKLKRQGKLSEVSQLS